MKKLPVMFTVLRLVVGFSLSAGPASAQSFCACDGTGNVLTFSNRAFIPANDKAVLSDRALRAYASDAYGASRPNAPEATGGWSLGYNEMLHNF